MIKKCLGCGIVLQTDNAEKDGYINDINNDLCLRCFKIKNYNEYKITTRDNKDYIKIINDINNGDDEIIYIASLLDFKDLNELDKLITKPMILVLTKRGLLPKSVKDNKIYDYFVRNGYFDKLNIKELHIVDSIKNYGINELYNSLDVNKKYYIIGSTNAGKSTLINKLLANYSDKNPEIVCSPYPSTTLDVLEIELGDITLIDTPGLIKEGSIVNLVSADVIKRISPKKEIKPIVYQINGPISIRVDDLVRIDYKTNNRNSMVVYASNMVDVERLGKNNTYMMDLPKRELKFGKNKDIVICDLCFIKLVNAGEIDVHASKEIDVYTRNNLI